MKLKLLLMTVVASFGVASADVLWTGEFNGTSLFQEGNWEDTATSNSPANNTINGNTPLNGGVAEDYILENASLNSVWSVLNLGNAATTFTLNNSVINLNFLDTDGFENGTMSLNSGSSIVVRYILNMTMNIDGTSAMTLHGPGNPINGSTVNLGAGATITFIAETVAAVNSEHLGKIFIGGSPLSSLSQGVDYTLVGNGASGSVLTAIGGGGASGVVWTGAGNGVAFYQEANWVDNATGSPPAAGTINGGSPLNGGVAEEYLFANVSLNSVGGGQLNLGSPDTDFTVENASLGIVNNNGISNGEMFLLSGSSVSSQFLLNLGIYLDGTSELTLTGGGNPVNNSVINLGLGAVINFNNESVTAVNNEHLGKIFIEGTRASDLAAGSDYTLVSSGANASTLTASSGGNRVVSFDLIDADSDEVLQPLNNNDEIDLRLFGTTSFNVRANVASTEGETQSVVFSLTGATSTSRTESSAPYTLAGDVGGTDFNPFSFGDGTHQLTATPYSANGGNGSAGTPLTVNFTVTSPRVWVVTDLEQGTGGDEDDDVCMATLLLLADFYTIEGISVLARPDITTGANTKNWVENNYISDYDDEVGLLNAAYGNRYQTTIDVYEASTAGQLFTNVQGQTNNPNYLNNNTQIRDLIDAADAGPLYLLNWGPLTEVAMVIKYCLDNNRLNALDNITLISHWTDIGNPFNCGKDQVACEYVHTQATMGFVEMIELGPVGEFGMVQDSCDPQGPGAPFSNELNINITTLSEIGKYFEEKWFQNCSLPGCSGMPDMSDAATLLVLLGFGGGLDTYYTTDGIPPNNQDLANDSLCGDRQDIFDLLEARCSVAAGL